jgi:hypothetical protein
MPKNWKEIEIFAKSKKSQARKEWTGLHRTTLLHKYRDFDDTKRCVKRAGLGKTKPGLGITVNSLACQCFKNRSSFNFTQFGPALYGDGQQIYQFESHLVGSCAANLRAEEVCRLWNLVFHDGSKG